MYTALQKPRNGGGKGGWHWTLFLFAGVTLFMRKLYTWRAIMMALCFCTLGQMAFCSDHRQTSEANSTKANAMGIEGLEDCAGTWISAWGYTIIITGKTLQFMDESPVSYSVTKKMTDGNYYEVETDSSRRSSFPKFLKFSLHGNSEILIEGRDVLARIDDQYSGIWFNPMTWFKESKTKPALSAEEKMFGYIGKWATGRGRLVCITAKTLQYENQVPVLYRDITRVTDGCGYDLEVAASEQSWFPRFLRVELTDNGTGMKVEGYNTKNYSGESQFSFIATKTK